MKSTCQFHGEQTFTPPNQNGDSFCTLCTAEWNKKLGSALWDDLHWRKYGQQLLHSRGETSSSTRGE